MAKKTSPELQTDRPTHATDFFATDVDKVKFYEDAMTDNIVTAILTLGSEIWTNRRRTLILERLLEEKGVSREMIENYMPSDEDVAEWQVERDRFVAALMNPLMRDASLPPTTDWQDED